MKHLFSGLFLSLLAVSCGGSEAGADDSKGEQPAGEQEVAGKSAQVPGGPKRQGEAYVWDFDDAPAAGGSALAGWAFGETNGAGNPATWRLVKDPTAPSQPRAIGVALAENTGQTYNIGVASGFKAADVSVRVSVNGKRGEEDQGGGPIWRVKDADNYYVCRINPLEDNYRVYKVVDGVRTQLASFDTPLEEDEWYDLRVLMKGNAITCWLDGQRVLEATDDSLPDAGRVGLWTKADARTLFDTLVAGEAK